MKKLFLTVRRKIDCFRLRPLKLLNLVAILVAMLTICSLILLLVVASVMLLLGNVSVGASLFEFSVRLYAPSLIAWVLLRILPPP